MNAPNQIGAPIPLTSPQPHGGETGPHQRSNPDALAALAQELSTISSALCEQLETSRVERVEPA